MFEQSAGYHQYLTEYAQGIYANPTEDLDLHKLLFPAIQVAANTGRYDVYAADPALTAVDTILARDGSPTRIQLDKRPDFWDCSPHAMEIGNFKPDLLQDNEMQIKEDSVNTLMSAQFTTRQVQAVQKVRSAITAVSGAGNWSASNADPIADIDALCKAVAMGCGRAPNTMLLGISAWARLRNHPAVLARIAGITTGATEQQVLEALTYKGITIHVAKTMAIVGGQMTELLANDIIVFYREDAPSRTDVSFGKEFTLSEDGPEVLEYEEKCVNVVDVLMWSSDSKVTNAAACARLEIAA